MSAVAVAGCQPSLQDTIETKSADGGRRSCCCQCRYIVVSTGMRAVKRHGRRRELRRPVLRSELVAANALSYFEKLFAVVVSSKELQEAQFPVPAVSSRENIFPYIPISDIVRRAVLMLLMTKDIAHR